MYSQTPVKKGDPLVISAKHEDHGRKFRAYRLLKANESPPNACTQKGNPVCRKPRWDKTLKRWQRPETYSEGLNRYWKIAKAISATKADVKVLEFATVVFRHESGMFRRDVHEGTNHKPYRQTTKHEDGGYAWGFGQIHWSPNPNAKVPMKGFEHLKMKDLVGLDSASTGRSVAVPIERLRRLVRDCGRNASCVFVGYAGTAISPNHKLIKARRSTYARLRKLTKKQRTLSDAVKKKLGIK